MLKMYREDVDELVAIFQRSCERVIISDKKYRYDSLDEMKQTVGPRVKDLDIRGENPGVRLLFNEIEEVKGTPSSKTVFNELRTEEITDSADALFREAKDFLLKYQQPYFRKILIAPTIVSLAGVVWFAIHDPHDPGTVRLSLGFLVSFAVFLASFIGGAANGNYLSLETKRNSQSFFVRNREDFAKHAITVLIAGIIGWAIGHFLK
jgi:hypothetical protein